MIISERTHNVLSLIKKNDIKDLSYSVQDKDTFENDMFFYDFVNRWAIIQPKCSKVINIVSETFKSAVEKSSDKLRYIFLELVKNGGLEINETFVLNSFTAVISGKFEIDFLNSEFSCFVFDTKSGAPAMYMSKDKNQPDLVWISRETATLFSKDMLPQLGKLFFWEFVYIKMFKEYAEVETKILKSGKRLVEIGTKYINNSYSDLTFLDSKWFTNLVKSDAFTVRGHFRLQPYKGLDSKWYKKIIWISEFEKEGYTSQAKISQ